MTVEIKHPLSLKGIRFLPLKSVDYLAVHCSATPPSMDIGVKEIDRWHRQRGFLCCGYHYVIRRDGTVEAGRPDDVMGAQVRGWNHCSIGFCLVGGVARESTQDHTTQAGRQKALRLVPEPNFEHVQLVTLHELLTTHLDKHPKAIVQGHRDFPNVTKACPSFDAPLWWQTGKVEGPARGADEKP